MNLGLDLMPLILTARNIVISAWSGMIEGKSGYCLTSGINSSISTEEVRPLKAILMVL